VALWRRAISLDERNWIPRYDLARSYEQSGQYDDRIREFTRVLEICEGNLRIKALLARLYAVTGRDAEARTILSEINGHPNSAFSMAEIWVALGEREQALRSLREAMRERCGLVVFIKTVPTLDSVRSDSRFQELIAEVNFPSASTFSPTTGCGRVSHSHAALLQEWLEEAYPEARRPR